MENFPKLRSAESKRLRPDLSQYSRRHLARIYQRSIQKAFSQISREPENSSGYQMMRSMTKKWLKRVVGQQRVAQQVMRRSRTLTFENLEKMPLDFKGSDPKASQHITDEDLEQDLKKSLDFQRSKTYSERRGDLELPGFVVEGAEPEGPLVGTLSSGSLTNSKPKGESLEIEVSQVRGSKDSTWEGKRPEEDLPSSKDGIVNKTSIYKIGDHLGEARKEEKPSTLKMRQHPLKQLKSIEDSKKKKRRSIFYQMSLVSQIEMEATSQRSSSSEQEASRGPSDSDLLEEAPRLHIIKSGAKPREEKQPVELNVFKEQPKAEPQKTGRTAEEFQGFLERVSCKTGDTKEEQIRRFLEMQLEIKRKMEEVIEEEDTMPKLIIKRKKKPQQNTREEQRRDSLRKLQEVNRFLMALNLEKRQRKVQRVRREKQFIEKLKHSGLHEKVEEHRRQLKELKQSRIKGNLRKIEERRRKREEGLRASNHLTRELLLQKREMDSRPQPCFAREGSKSKTRVRGDPQDRFYNKEYIKMKKSQLRVIPKSQFKSESPKKQKGGKLGNALPKVGGTMRERMESKKNENLRIPNGPTQKKGNLNHEKQEGYFYKSTPLKEIVSESNKSAKFQSQKVVVPRKLGSKENQLDLGETLSQFDREQRRSRLD